MRTLVLKTVVLGLALLIIASIDGKAQPAEKAKERIAMMKKMKLLEILDLDESASEKLMIKYNALEKKVEAQMEKVEKSTDDLVKAVKNGGSKDEIKKKSDELVSNKEKLLNIHIENMKEMKSVLNETEYAKYLIFEERFNRELGKMLFKRGMGRNRGGRGGDNDFEPPPPPEE